MQDKKIIPLLGSLMEHSSDSQALFYHDYLGIMQCLVSRSGLYMRLLLASSDPQSLQVNTL